MIFSTTVCNWITKSTGCGGVICNLLLFYRIFPIQSRFNEDPCYKKQAHLTQSSAWVHQRDCFHPRRFTTKPHLERTDFLWWRGWYDHVGIYIESQHDLATYWVSRWRIHGSLGVVVSGVVVFFGRGGEGRVRIFPTQNNRGQLRCCWIPEFSDFCSLDLVIPPCCHGRHLRGLVE